MRMKRYTRTRRGDKVACEYASGVTREEVRGKRGEEGMEVEERGGKRRKRKKGKQQKRPPFRSHPHILLSLLTLPHSRRPLPPHSLTSTLSLPLTEPLPLPLLLHSEHLPPHLPQPILHARRVRSNEGGGAVDRGGEGVGMRGGRGGRGG